MTVVYIRSARKFKLALFYIRGSITRAFLYTNGERKNRVEKIQINVFFFINSNEQ